MRTIFKPPAFRHLVVLPRHLAGKLIICLTLIVAVVAGVFQILTVRSQEHQLVQEAIQGADQLSRSIASATWQAMQANKRESAYAVMKTIAEKQEIDRIRIYNRDGWLMFSTAAEEQSRLDKRDEACVPCHAREQPLVKPAVNSRARLLNGPDGRRKLAMITPIYNEAACSGADCHAHPAALSVLGVLDVRLDLGRIDNEVAAIRQRMLLMVIIEIAVIVIFIVVFTHHFVSLPIRQLIAGTQAVSAMRLDEPIEIHSSEELGELARSFNRMRGRLQEEVAKNAEFTQQLEVKVAERTAQLQTASEKLKQTGRLASLGQLAASVAHEINNPVAGVLNLSMLLQRILTPDGIPPRRLDEFRAYLDRIVQETGRIGRIVSGLLAFSRRSKPQRSHADLNQVIRSTLALVMHQLELAGIQPVLELATELPPVYCDASQIQQVVMNLLLNAAEAARGRGPLTVRSGRETGPERIFLEVADQGAGMPPDVLEHIYEPFYTTKEEGKGVGLGLAVVYGIVEAHGGEIEVHSVIDRGTTFRVHLPLTGPEEQSAADREH